MGVELVPVTENPKLNITLELDIALSAFELDIEELGILRRTYTTYGFVMGKRDNTYGVFMWIVLTDQASEDGLGGSTYKKVKSYTRSLKEEVAGFGLPLEVYTSFVRLEREQALKNHLERNKINYTKS